MTTPPRALRVLIVDDHALIRAGLSSVLSVQEEIVVCGEASDGEQAVLRYEELRPDVTLMDLQMPLLDGLAAIAKIRARHRTACILVLTTFDNYDDIERALRAGARGYLLKDAKAEELTSAIRAAHAGATRVAPAVAARLADQVTQLQLTVRELAVLRLLAHGKPNKDIAAELSITESTVKVHLSRVFEKLGVSNRTEAITAAARRGLLRRG
jgi:two-component system, NarL family, response regulator